jgi:hypothetical protein
VSDSGTSSRSGTQSQNRLIALTGHTQASDRPTSNSATPTAPEVATAERRQKNPFRVWACAHAVPPDKLCVSTDDVQHESQQTWDERVGFLAIPLPRTQPRAAPVVRYRTQGSLRHTLRDLSPPKWSALRAGFGSPESGVAGWSSLVLSFRFIAVAVAAAGRYYAVERQLGDAAT